MSRLQRIDALRQQRQPKRTVRELADLIKRQIKRKLIQDGVVVDPATQPPRWEWHWQLSDLGGIVQANTRGEARSQIKKLLCEEGLLAPSARLPIQTRIVRVEPNADTTHRPESYQISSDER